MACYWYTALVVVISAVSRSRPVSGTAEVMSHVTAHFGKALEECREESGLSPDILEQFQHFWREDFEVVHRELGCALICMSNKFALMQDDARMHHMNMHDYVKNFPNGLSPEILKQFQHYWSEEFVVVHHELGCALICMSNKFALMQDDDRLHHVNMHDYVISFPNGELLSAKMVELIHNCEKEHDDIEDDCSRVVKVAACFKTNAKKEGIAPEVTMIEAVLEKYK